METYARLMKLGNSFPLPRRGFLATLGTLTAFSILNAGAPRALAEQRKGRLKQGLCLSVFSGTKLDMDGKCREAARLGAYGIDLVGPNDFPVLKKYGLVPTMVPGGTGIKSGINDKKNHADMGLKMGESIKAAAAAGAPNVIALAGDRKGISDEEGLENSVIFLNNAKKAAEDLGVTLCLELLNSKVDHPGYMCDHTTWGVEVCKRVNSPRVKLLYDIYHMQIMEGDIVRTIKNNIQYIGHFHTAGNPGRHQFDDSQEMNYTGICKGIADTGYQGCLSHEYSPSKGKDPLETLDAMMRLCEV
jgi:hydroxypyruvate isomerase